MEYLASLGHRMTHHCDNATYGYRIDDPDNFNFCAVPSSGVDVILFIVIALVVSIAFSSRLSAIFILLIGAVLQFISYQTNLGRLSNALTLWLRMQPAEMFMSIFLPPLLLDSAVKLDFHLLKKILLLALLFAFVLVMLSTILSVPILLYALDLASQGWTWVHCGLFSAMIASTDAVAVSAVLKSGGAPEMLSALLEGESLFNDASGLVMFDIFLRMLPSSASTAANTLDQHTDNNIVDRKSDIQWAELKGVAGQFVWLAGGGLAMGLAYGFGTVQLMRWLQRRRQKPHVEVTVTLVGTYLAYYTTSLYLGASGVIACVVFGLYGAASMNWRMSLKSKREASMQRFWDVVSFSLNGIVFFYVGASSSNFLIRLGVDLSHDGSSIWEIMKDLILTLPLIYVAFFMLRGTLIMLFVFIAEWFGVAATPPWQGIVFATVGGLRGALSLILAQTMLTLHSNTKVQGLMDTNSKTSQERKVLAQMGLWTTGFVLLTLLLNAPLLGPLLSLLKLNKPSAAKVHVRLRVRHALLRYTEHTLDTLQAESETTGLRGVDWESVRRYVSLERALQRVLPKAEFEPSAPRQPLLQQVLSRAGLRRRARPTDASPHPEHGVDRTVDTPETSRLFPQDSLTEPLLQRQYEGDHPIISRSGSAQRVGSLSARARARAGDITPYVSLQSPSIPSSRPSMQTLSRDVSGRRSHRNFRVDTSSLDTTSALGGGVQGPVARSAPISRSTSYATDLQYEALMSQTRQSSCFFATKPGDEVRPSASLTGNSPVLAAEPAPQDRSSSMEGASTSPAASPLLPEGCMAITVRSRSKLQDHELGVVEEEETPVASEMEHNYSQEARIPNDEEIDQFIAEMQAASVPATEQQERGMHPPFQRDTQPFWLQTVDECPGILAPQASGSDVGPRSASSTHVVSPFAAMAAATTTETVEKAADSPAAKAVQSVAGLGAALLAESAAVGAVTGAVTGTTVAAAGAQPRLAATAATAAAKMASEVAVASAAPIVSTMVKTAATFSNKGAAERGAWRPIPTGAGSNGRSSYKKQLSSLSTSTFKQEPELNIVQRSLSMTAEMATQIRRSLRLSRAMTGSQGSLILLTKEPAGSGEGRKPSGSEKSSSSSSSGEALKMQLSIGGSPATKPMTVEIPGTASVQFPMEELFDDYVSSPAREGTAKATSSIVESASHKEALAEYRIRLLSGLKRAFHARHVEGLLSSRGLRILDSCIDAAMDVADQQPLDVWQRVEQEVSNTALVRLQASLHLQLRRAYSTARYAGFCGGWLVAPLLQWLSHLLGTNLSRHMVLGLEAAIEVHDALTYTPQALWLTYSGGKAGQQLQDEVQEQRHKVWQYMLDREVEAPERFGAIQTHRASMAVLRAQTGFVGHLLETGMIDERECEGLMVPLERQMWKLETKGPKWRHPSLLQVLAGVHFLRGVKPEMLDWLRSQGELALYPKGACITSDISHVFIVVSGMVRVTFPAAQQASPVSAGQQRLDAVLAASEDGSNVATEDEAAYVGTGGVVRLSRGLLGQSIPGLSVTSVHAEGNALGNGPILFHIPDDTIAKIREYSARGSPHFKDLEAGMFCLLATNLLDRYRAHIITYLVQLLVLQYQDQIQNRQPTPVSTSLGKPPAVNLHTGFVRPGADAEPELEEDIVEGDEESEEDIDHLAGDGLRGMPGVSERQMQRFIDQGIMLFDRLRPRLQSASLLRLGPRQRLTQQCMVVLLSGSMVQNNHVNQVNVGAGADNGADASSNHVDSSEHGTAHSSAAATYGTSLGSQWVTGAHLPMMVFKPPQMVLWLPDILDNAFLRVIDFTGGEFIAGPTGAVLVVCDNRRQRVAV